MAETQKASSEGKEAKSSEGLNYIYETMSLSVPDHAVEISGFKNAEALAESKANERIGAALAFFVDSILRTTKTVSRIDKAVLDNQIAEIDRKISAQLDDVLHNPSFQKMEAAWRSLKFLVDRTDFRKNVKIDILDVSKEELAEDFEDAPETIQSGLYKHVYVSEYDTPGGEPYGTIVSNYEFD